MWAGRVGGRQQRSTDCRLDWKYSLNEGGKAAFRVGKATTIDDMVLSSLSRYRNQRDKQINSYVPIVHQKRFTIACVEYIK